MKRAKEAFNEIRTDLGTSLMRIAVGDTSVFTKTDKVLAVIIGLFMCLLFMTQFACALEGEGDSNSDLFSEIGTQFSTFYSKLVGLSTVIAAVCIIGGFLWTMVSPGQKTSAVPIAWIKKVFFCYFLILILGGLFGLIKNVTNSYNTWTPSTGTGTGTTTP